MNKKYIIGILTIVISAVSIVIYNNFKKEDIEYEFNSIYTNEAFHPQSQESIEKFGSAEDIIKIHITGEVKSQGLIELDIGSRILDAIEKAGGVTDLADVTKVNLAYILSDGEKIYIPSINDKEDVNYIVSSNSSNSKVNINTASVEDLKALNGIGESTAQLIVTYRTENGRFSKIEDIKNISGIGDSKFNKIKDYICVK